MASPPGRAAEIAVEAYSPLTRGQKLSHRVVVEIAKRIQRSPAQVLLRWSIQKNVIVLPKSTHEARIDENAALFDFTLDAQAMSALDGLEENLTTGWDPAEQP
jgi:diketogulonate reductase-like aldo/keto reductase